MVGNIRTWELCRENFVDVLGRLGPEVFITTYNRQYAYHPYVQQSLNFHQDVDLDAPSIRSMFSELDVQQIMINDIDSYVNTWVKPLISSRFPEDAFLTLAQYFKLHDGMKMILEQERLNGYQYDCIMKTRFDVTYNEFDPTRLKEEVYVDGSDACVFPCDWTFIASRKNALAIDQFIYQEMLDMKHESSLVDLPHKLFLNGIKASGAELRAVPLISGIVRAG